MALWLPTTSKTPASRTTPTNGFIYHSLFFQKNLSSSTPMPHRAASVSSIWFMALFSR